MQNKAQDSGEQLSEILEKPKADPRAQAQERELLAKKILHHKQNRNRYEKLAETAKRRNPKIKAETLSPARREQTERLEVFAERERRKSLRRARRR